MVSENLSKRLALTPVAMTDGTGTAGGAKCRPLTAIVICPGVKTVFLTTPARLKPEKLQ